MMMVKVWCSGTSNPTASAAHIDALIEGSYWTIIFEGHVSARSCLRETALSSRGVVV